MYLYRTQYYILKSLNKKIVATDTPMDNLYMSLLELINDAPPNFSNKMKRYPRAHSALSAKKYIEYGGVAQNKTVLIKMTQAGLDALANQEFQVKQDNLRAVIVRDALIAISGFIVAIATIYALIQSKSESKQTQEEIKQLQQEVHKQKTELNRQADSLQATKNSLYIHITDSSIHK